MFKQYKDDNHQKLLKKLEIIERTAVDKNEYQQISKTVQLKKILNRDLKIHTSIWGSHNPSWNTGTNNFLKKEWDALNNSATSVQNVFSDSTWSDKKQVRQWNENMKNNSNKNASSSHWERKYDSNQLPSACQ